MNITKTYKNISSVLDDWVDYHMASGFLPADPATMEMKLKDIIQDELIGYAGYQAMLNEEVQDDIIFLERELMSYAQKLTMRVFSLS